jgi:gliding motility-associated-like protein
MVGALGDANRTLAATSNNSQGAFTYQSSNAAVGSISGSTLTIQGKGIAEITATQAAAGFYLGASAKAVLLVKDPTKPDPTLTWISPLSKTLDDVTVTVPQATSNSTGAITYYSSNPQVATISNRTVTLVGNGVTVLTAAQEETDTYNAGKAVTILIVGDPYKLPAQLTGLANVTKLVTDAAFTITAPSTQSAATIQYVLGDDRIASISGNTITLKTNGTTKIYALQKETATHQAAMTEATLQVNLPPVPVIDYSDALNLRVGTNITPLTPTSTAGTVTQYSVWPPLPAGLTLNAQSGVIQGTPTVLAEPTTYQVTGSNLGGPAQTPIQLSVIDLAPTNLSYTSPRVLIKDQVSTAAFPTLGGGGAVVSYTITPALPVGLTFNTGTGEISGTPLVISTASNYTIKAINSGGEASFTLSLTVNDIAPASLSYPSPNQLSRNVAMAPLSPITTGGQITQYSVIGTALPVGLTLNAQTGVISGAPTGVFDLTTFTIRGQNPSGLVDATLEIASNDSPPVIAYTSPTRVTKGQAMTSLTPVNTGGPSASFTISPELPTGLSFNETNGVISGTPTVLSPAQVYRVVAYNFSGEGEFALNFGVNDVPPSALSYAGATTFTKGTAIANLSPTASGGPITQYSIAPNLPQGLALDPATGIISGTPTALMAATSFTITATNSGGSTTFSLSLTVNDVAPSALTYPSREDFVRGTAIQAMAATASGGTVISYSIAPALPAGLAFNTSTGEITGTPTAVAAAANYVVTATNSGGSTTATLSLQVRKSTLLVTVDAATKVFGQADPTFAVTYSGFVLGEGAAQVSGQAAYARTAGENVGNYAVTASGLSSALYEFNYQAGTLSITRKSVATGISIDAIANQTYTGAALTPALVVKDGNSTLTLGTDYTLAYTSNTNVGTATATITGIGNYSGTKTQTFAIVTKAASMLTIDAIANQTYTGLALTPGVVVKDGSTTLTATTDYTVAYTNNTNVGTATVTITGAGNYSGTKTQTFAIVGKGASTLTIDAIANQTYTGAALTPGVVVRDGNTALTLTTDYTVAYTNNTNVGTATVTITGAGNYSGTKTQTFAIVTKAASMLTIDAIANQTYTGSALTPALVVKDGNTTLTLTTDYTVAYTSNTNVGTATVTITGAGNYSGTKTQTFTIVAKAASTLTIDAIANQNFTGAALTPAVLVKDGSATLTLGTDYSVAYTNNVNVGTATVTITGLGNYSGTKTQTFEILTKMASLLTIEAVANQTYTGAALSPAVVVKDGSTTLTLGTDYSVAYSNNTNAGTASLTITGLGVYSGTKTASFVIGKAPLTVRVVNASKNYGQADPGFGVTYSGFLANQTASLLSGTLTFSRAAGQNPGIYAVTASGLSSANYSFTYVSGTLTIVAVDTDGDGVPDHVEDQDGTDSNDPRDSKDSDGDGVPDYVEIEDGTDPSDPKDYKDSDGDGVPDYVEAQDGTDPSDPRDYKDSDGDGVPDYVEIQDGTDPNDPRDYKDSDGDGVPDYVEIQDGTDPSDPKDYKDSDGDGVPDYVEVQNGTDPSDPKDYKDSDGDGVPDYVEIQDGTDPDNPIGAKDSDGDGVPDFVEKQQGTDPANPRSFLDSDGGGVPDHVETVVYPRLGLSKSNPTNSIDDFSDRDGDGVSDYQEYLEGTDPRDPSDYKDSDGDGVPDQVEIKEGSNPNSASSFKDSDGDGVADYIQIRSFREGTPTDLVVLWGDSNFASKLSNRVLMRTSRNELVSVQVTWDDLSGVKPLARGTYLAKGTVVVPKGYFNPYKIKGLERVIVLPKAAPLDVTLTNSSFVGSTSTYFISVGDFAVTDPVDKVHVVSLNGPGYDNKYFEIKNNILFWSSADLAAGKTKFSIIVRVTDRDGNTLDKFFEISRSRPSVSDITIYNSFSPNGDGINDTWGIEAARFYSGTKLQIFDRGGVRIFNSEDPTQRWDGTYQGKELPIGTYYWILEVGETGEMRRGVLNVLKK